MRLRGLPPSSIGFHAAQLLHNTRDGIVNPMGAASHLSSSSLPKHTTPMRSWDDMSTSSSRLTCESSSMSFSAQDFLLGHSPPSPFSFSPTPFFTILSFVPLTRRLRIFGYRLSLESVSPGFFSLCYHGVFPKTVKT
ncbi:hypothetical protein K461DRAFT_165233 [Myriangium duriaei CBS 260.36]|uniref:Uncharacterized protein n=1 Tax=Myriangium duriaei CBS 260.36 TaxID=1168546 RepID=A0A9P4J257_9PEZI|nr:hypothetical protein K461DRAFT_165233 [Myriangium duriaei CBS 260.36]